VDPHAAAETQGGDDLIEIPRLRAPIWAAVLLLGAGLAIQTAPVSQAAVSGCV